MRSCLCGRLLPRSVWSHQHGVRTQFPGFFLTFTIPNFGRGLLRWAALFLGELRDGLTMINMQSAFLIVSKQYSEKQAGVLFFGEFYCALPTVG